MIQHNGCIQFHIFADVDMSIGWMADVEYRYIGITKQNQNIFIEI